MASLTKNTFSSGSVVETLVAAAAGGDTVPDYTSKDFIIIKNAHGTNPRTVTFVNQEVDSHGHDTDVAIAVAALTTRIFDLASLPGTVKRWQNGSGALEMTYSDSAADLTVGAFTRP